MKLLRHVGHNTTYVLATDDAPCKGRDYVLLDKRHWIGSAVFERGSWTVWGPGCFSHPVEGNLRQALRMIIAQAVARRLDGSETK